MAKKQAATSKQGSSKAGRKVGAQNAEAQNAGAQNAGTQGAGAQSAKRSGGARKPAMPAALPDRDGARRGGLGRGLASLIPSGPSRPGLGNGAADVILGGGGSVPASRSDHSPTGAGTPSESGSEGGKGRGGSGVGSSSGSSGISDTATSNPSDFRHSDVNRPTPGMGGKSEAGNKKGAKRYPQGDPSAAQDIGATYQELPLDSIGTNPKQPRTVFDEDQLNELVHSIREFGLMQPIVVRPVENAEAPYELIMGERRLRASKKAGMETIPAIVRETQDDAMLRDALLENIHRVQLNPLEEAAAYQQLLEEFGVTQEQLAARIGRSRSLIANMIRLLQLPVSVQRRVSARVLSAGHARALLGLKAGEQAQSELADRIVAEGLSVRATEEAVTLMNRGDEKPEKRARREPAPLPDYVNSWVEDFSDALETKVSVQMGKKRGKIVVEFGGQEDFDRIVEILQQGEQH